MICHVLSVILMLRPVLSCIHVHTFNLLSLCCKKSNTSKGITFNYKSSSTKICLQIGSIATDFSASSEFPPSKKSKKPTPHIGNSEEVYIFAAWEHHFHAFFFVKKSVKPSPLSPHSWVDHVPPRGEFVDPWKSVCESNGCWWTLGRKEKEWRLTDVSCLPVTSRVITSLIRVTCYPFIRSFVRGITHNSIYN